MSRTKRCGRCGNNIPIEEFVYTSRLHKTPYEHAVCKRCADKERDRWFRDHPRPEKKVPEAERKRLEMVARLDRAIAERMGQTPQTY